MTKFNKRLNVIIEFKQNYNIDNMLKEFEDILNEMDSKLTKYSQKITYEQKLFHKRKI